MKVLLDTNIIISAALFKGGKTAVFLQEVIQYHEIYLSDYTIYELKEVVGRKFPAQKQKMDIFLSFFIIE